VVFVVTGDRHVVAAGSLDRGGADRHAAVRRDHREVQRETRDDEPCSGDSPVHQRERDQHDVGADHHGRAEGLTGGGRRLKAEPHQRERPPVHAESLEGTDAPSERESGDERRGEDDEYRQHRGRTGAPSRRSGRGDSPARRQLRPAPRGRP